MMQLPFHMDLPKRYQYNFPLWLALLTILFFGLCTVVIGSTKTHTDRGLIIFHLIELGPAGARIFYWMLTTFGALLTLTGIMMLVRGAVFPRFLELGDEALTLPYGFLATKTNRILYTDIKEFWEGRVNHNTTLIIVTSDGRQYGMQRSFFDDPAHYAEVRDYLGGRTLGNAARPAPRHFS
jgi:hypothetical protein